MLLKVQLCNIGLYLAGLILFGAWSIDASDVEKPSAEKPFTGLSDAQIKDVRQRLTSVGGTKCTNLFFQKDFEEYLICASQWHAKRFPKQDFGDGDGGDEDTPLFIEQFPAAGAQVISLLTDAFTGINYAVNQTSAGQSQSLPTWIFNGVSTLLGGVGQAVGIKPPAPTPPLYFNLPPARPAGPSVTYPSNSLSQGQRYRPTLVPKRSTTTSKPIKRRRPTRASTTSRTSSAAAGSAPPTEGQLSPFQIQYVGPAGAPPGASGQFFPAPTKIKPAMRATRRTTTRVPIQPQDTSTDTPTATVESSNAGFHSELLNLFANKPKQSSSTPSYNHNKDSMAQVDEEIGESSSDIQSSVPVGSSAPVLTNLPPLPPSFTKPVNQNNSPLSLWQAIAHIKATPLINHAIQSNAGYPPISPGSSYVIIKTTSPQPSIFEEYAPALSPPISHTTSLFIPPEEHSYPSYPSKLVTESYVHPKFPSSAIATVGIENHNAEGSTGNRRPVIINNMYYPDLQTALSATASSSTTEKPRKRRRRTTSTTTPTPSSSQDPDYYEDENTSSIRPTH